MKKMSKEEWTQRHKDLIEHKSTLITAIERLDGYNRKETVECEHLVDQLKLTDMAIKIAETEAKK